MDDIDETNECQWCSPPECVAFWQTQPEAEEAEEADKEEEKEEGKCNAIFPTCSFRIWHWLCQMETIQ